MGHGVWLVFGRFVILYAIGISQFLERYRRDAGKSELKERRKGAPKGGYFSLYLVGTWMASRFVLVGLMTYGSVAASGMCVAWEMWQMEWHRSRVTFCDDGVEL